MFRLLLFQSSTQRKIIALIAVMLSDIENFKLTRGETLNKNTIAVIITADPEKRYVAV